MSASKLFISILCIAASSATAERVADGDGRGSGINYFSFVPPSNVEPPMKAAEIQCRLEVAGWKASDARDAAVSVEDGIRRMGGEWGDKFNKNSLIHFLSQISAESGNGTELTELSCKDGDEFTGNKNKCGFGYLQVTGASNLKATAECLNEIPPEQSLGIGITQRPHDLIGANATNKGPAMFASLCWWQDNMVFNKTNSKNARAGDLESAQKVHEYVNAGGVGREVTGGSAEIKKRKEIFKLIRNEGDKACASSLVSSR